MNELIKTKDGSHSIYVPELNEHYHSTHGALQEAIYVFIQQGFDYCMVPPIRLLEVGFGTGLNALLTALKSRDFGMYVEYEGLEKYPLDIEIVAQLNYADVIQHPLSRTLFNSMHNFKWNEESLVHPYFKLTKTKCDYNEWEPSKTYNLVYFNAFGPRAQPEMWNEKGFLKLYSCMEKGGILVTYSSKGDVRRALEKTGFRVDKLPGPIGKREMLRAIKL